MKLLRAFLLVVLLGSPAVLVAAEDKIEGDLGKFQGTWTAMVGPEKNIPLTATFKGKEILLKVNLPNGDDIELKGEVKVDEKATPKTLDWTKFTRPDGQSIGDNLAIYTFEDNDTVKVCSGGPDNARPKEFKESDAGEQYPSVITLKRKKS